MENLKYNLIQQAALKERQEILKSETEQIEKVAEMLKIDISFSFEIGNLTIPQIVSKLNEYTLTSQQLLTALALRTIKIAKEFNLITYLYFRNGLKVARKCDQERKNSGKKNITIEQMSEIKQPSEYDNFFPPLYGIPISIKDVYHLQGREATAGLSSRVNKQHDQSTLVSCFRNSGMIPFVQTNIAQLCIRSETNNFLWGRSLNPWNKQRSAGGSSGGEGGMINARCSVLGVGSDIAGSIRAPAEHNGIFGLKPSSKRISNTYHLVLSKDLWAYAKNIPNCIGPLGKSAEDLALFMSVTTTQRFYKGRHDPYTKIVPFDSKAYLNAKSLRQKLKIGYITTLKDIEPSTASQRALNEVIQMLKNDGHELVQVEVPNERQIIREFYWQFLSCQGKNYQKVLAGQKNVKQIQGIFIRGQARSKLAEIKRSQSPRSYFYFFQKQAPKQLMDYQQHMGLLQEFRSEWIDYWRQQQLDLILCPGYACQAFRHGTCGKAILSGAYANIWNTLDMTVGSMPVTVVREDQQEYISQFQDQLTQTLKQIAKDSVGLPVGVQVVGMPYAEETVLGFMSYLQEKIKFYTKYGAPKIQPN